MLRRPTRAPCVLRATTPLMAMAQLLTRAALSVLRRAILTLELVMMGVSCVLRATTPLMVMHQALTRAALSVLRRAILTLELVMLGVQCVQQATTLVTVMHQALTRAALSVKPMRAPRAVNLATEATTVRAPVMRATTALRIRRRLLVV